MPDWADVNFLQTIILVAATGLAWLTYRGEKDAHADAAIEGRLDRVAERVAEAAATATLPPHVSGNPEQHLVALRNLRSALAAVPEELPKTRKLLDAPPDDLALGPVVDEALREIAAEIERRTQQRFRFRIGRRQ